MSEKHGKIQRSEAEWQQILGPDRYYICRQKGTEPPFSGIYCDHHADGVYRCAGCGQALFDSTTKYESGSGWPSFFAAIDDDRIDKRLDQSHGMERIEITCACCGTHLGHLFPDGPEPTGLRYCTNSAALDFSATRDDE